jgi:hypothetical protein
VNTGAGESRLARTTCLLSPLPKLGSRGGHALPIQIAVRLTLVAVVVVAAAVASSAGTASGMSSGRERSAAAVKAAFGAEDIKLARVSGTASMRQFVDADGPALASVEVYATVRQAVRALAGPRYYIEVTSSSPRPSYHAEPTGSPHLARVRNVIAQWYGVHPSVRRALLALR